MYGGKKVGGAPSDSHFEAALQKEMERWYDAAKRWMGEGKLVMRDIITEIMEETDQDTDDVANDAMALLSKWALGGTDAAADAERLWTNAVSAIAVAERAQRAGNRSVLRGLPIFGDSKYWWAQDVVVLAASYALHLAVAPHWDGISSAATRSWEITKGIAMRRFIRPAADIVDDLILNRRPRLLDRAILADAELSLDNMLMDLRLAERTEGRLASSARAAALSAASREYEAQLASGTIRNLLWGNSARLILVQVQQLKAEMLRAFGAIDDLVDANRLNVQLLAAIPSVLLAFGATRLFVVGMFALRSRDGLVRSMRDVHEEMEDHLLGMERCVMLAKAKGAENDKGEVRKPSRTNTEAGAGCGRLRGMELGEFVLLSHSYLILLDYSSPVVSSRAADVVHQDVQNLLSIGSFCVNVDQQAALLNSIKARHKKLLRF
uniref:Nuclear control of ATPase protein 2 n=1 Tax=Corethron hystrix TaxID=216773 RepID=A0A7S1BBG8_9STRA